MQIKISGLSKQYDKQTVIHPLDLQLDNCHALVMIGPSGGGKTTLLRIIAGLEKPTTGMLSVNGYFPEYQEDLLRQYRKTIGVVFQAYNLFPHLTALENVVLPLMKVHGLSSTLAKENALHLFEKFRLTDHLHKKPGQLSGGQKQRVAIVRALSIKPQFLLMDEPTSALDPALTAEVFDMILQLKEENIDLILVTHEMGLAQTVAEYALFLSDGILIEKGYRDDFFNKPKTEELSVFLNSTFRFLP